MQKTLIIKLSIIAILCFIFGIGLNMFSSVITERQNYSNTVINEIAEQHVFPQQVITPFIVVPTTLTPVCESKSLDDDSKCPKPYTKLETVLAYQTSANHEPSVSTDIYQRGIYNAISYKDDLSFTQSYQLDDLQQIITDNKTDTKPKHDVQQEIDWQQARLIMPVSDLRGVTTLPTVTFDTTTIKATYPETQLLNGLSYIEAALPPQLLTKILQTQQASKTNAIDAITSTDINSTDTTSTNTTEGQQVNGERSTQLDTSLTPSAITIKVQLSLSGISSLSTVATGQNFEMNMKSNWHSPNFIGSALPNDKTITSDGFDASWQNQYLTVDNNQRLQHCVTDVTNNCHLISSAPLDTSSETVRYYESTGFSADRELSNSVRLSGFGVSFAEPNDVYLQTERTMKYALLLILVSFGTFFLFEVIKSSRIHPIQYLLVGSALLVFYVLLLPLAEQITFWQAYAIAAAACVGLIGWYSYYVLGNVKRAVIFTCILSALYAAFFGILTTEDLNLLLGAVFCFVILAGVMIMTRKIDWYKVA